MSNQGHPAKRVFQALRIAVNADSLATWFIPAMALQFAMVEGAEGGLSSLTAMTVGGGPRTTCSRA